MPANSGKRKKRCEGIETEEKRCFSNLTNFKSPKNQKIPRNKSISKTPVATNNLKKYFSPVGTQKSGSESESQLAGISSQSKQITVSQIPPQTPGEAFNTINCIKKVLEENYKDVSGRLQLKTIPSYLYDLKAFSDQKDIQFALSENEYLAKNYVEEDRLIFINFVTNVMCGHREFPGSQVLRGILDMILKISDESQTLFSSSQQVIIELYSLFLSIIATFPPAAVCDNGRNTLRYSYLKMFQLPFKVFGIHVTSPDRGILHSMLDLIFDLLYQSQQKSVSKSQKAIEQDQFTNFWLWDAHKNEKCSFANFSREEKFTRIFLVLDLLVQVLENDLAMFIVKYSDKLRSSIESEDTCPLVCCLLWRPQHDSLNVLNSTIKNIIRIFVDMIGLQYPKQNVEVLSRLLNLVSHVLNVYECPEDTIACPSYKNTTLNLVHEIQKTSENSVYYSMNLILDVIEHTRSPLTQMLLVNKILENIHKTSKPISLEVPFDLIRKKTFLKFENVIGVTRRSDKKFPFYDPNRKLEPLEFTQRGYLKLLRVYAGAVNKYYRIQLVLIEAKKHELDKEEVVTSVNSEPFDFAKFEEKLSTVDLSEKVKPRVIDLSLKKLVHIKMSKTTCSFYMDQIKHFWMLKELMKKCRPKYGAKFDEWKDLFDGMETGV